MYRLGLYGYGFEKCYSRKALRQMLEKARVSKSRTESGILFIPGWAADAGPGLPRAWCRPLGRLTGYASQLFARLANRFPSLHRHGYLIVAVGVRPSDSEIYASGSSLSGALSSPTIETPLTSINVPVDW